MSTRANIIFKDTIRDEIHQAYRHNDGYPSETGDELKRFCKRTLFDKAKILDKMSKSISKYTKRSYYNDEGEGEAIHGDIEWLYVIDLTHHTLTAYHVLPFQFTPTLTNIESNHIEKIELIK